jgi:hypothetical protein
MNIDLRDHFAAACIPEAMRLVFKGRSRDDDVEMIARLSYEIADAMMMQRGVKR